MIDSFGGRYHTRQRLVKSTSPLWVRPRPKGRLRFVLLVAAAVLAVPVVGAGQEGPTLSYTRFDTGSPGPVLMGGGSGAWDEFLREKISVIEEGGVFKMWYVGHTAAGQHTSKVGYATSTDGINWVKYTGNPVINRASQDQDICVVKAADGATHHMYVEKDDSYIDLLTSTDGIHWTAYNGNPIKRTAVSPVVWREGSNWYMLYEDMTGPVFDIHLASSLDGITWTDSPSNPIVADTTSTVPDSVVKEGSTYHLYYHKFENPLWPAWHAVSSNLTTWTGYERLFTNFSSQWTFRTSDGKIRAYLWNLGGDGYYYLRYGMDLASLTIWPLDEGTGTTVLDSSGNGAIGVLINGPTWTTGQSGSALSFDGVDDEVRVGYFANLANWTVAVWVMSPAAPSSGPASEPVNRNRNFQINWNHPNTTFRGAAALTVDGTEYAASFGPLAANIWYHLAATYDGETLRAYKNGVLVMANTAPSGNADVESVPLTFGRQAATAQYFAGTVDEVRVYSRVLTDAEIAALVTYTISGTVTSGGSGLQGVVMNGFPGNPTTSPSGVYTTTVNSGWSGTVTPTLAAYSFTPPSRTYTNVTSNQTGQDYTATPLTYTISGTVTISGAGLQGVVMNGLPGNPTTNASGAYAATVSHGWSGTITPTLSGYSFIPASRTYSNLTSDQTNQNYLAGYTISGTVTRGGAGLQGVVMNGFPGNPTTNSSGIYTATVNYGWSGTVMPTLAGYSFTPPSRTYTNVTSNQTGQDYTATLLTYTISGTVTVSGAGFQGMVMNGLPGSPTTNSSGAYTATVDYGWSGTVTPTLAGYAFTPPSRTYSNVTSNQTGQDYTAATITITISGTVTINGAGLQGVVMNGLPGSPTTNASGVYTATVDYSWSGTVTPPSPAIPLRLLQEPTLM